MLTSFGKKVEVFLFWRVKRGLNGVWRYRKNNVFFVKMGKMNAKKYRHPEFISGSLFIRRFRNKFGMTGATRIGSTSLRSVFNCVKYFVRTLHVLTVAHQPNRQACSVFPIRNTSFVRYHVLIVAHWPKNEENERKKNENELQMSEAFFSFRCIRGTWKVIIKV